MVMKWTDQGVNIGINTGINSMGATIVSLKKVSCTRFDMDNTIERCALNPLEMVLFALSMSMIHGLNAAVRSSR